MTTNSSPPDWRGLCENLADELDAETGYTRSDGKRITHVDVARARGAWAASAAACAARDAQRDAFIQLVIIGELEVGNA